MIKPTRKTAAWTAVAFTAISGFEGLRLNAYADVGPHHALTICFGDTLNVHPGEHRTEEQCDEGLRNRMWVYYDGIWQCLPQIDSYPPERQAALVSFTWWRGAGGFCHSAVKRRLAAGDIRGGCDALLSYDSISGVYFPGLARRRRAERELCLKGS